MCTLALPGICNHDPETVVFCHLNGAAFGKGLRQKSHDIAGFHGCAACHRYYDSTHGTKPTMSDADLARSLLRAVIKTWVNLIYREIIKLPLDPDPTPFSERPIAPRKPRQERQKISGTTRWPPKGSRGIRSRNGLSKSERQP
jgi:hypothetical protein